MLPLINCQAISKSYFSEALFEDLNFRIHPKDRLTVVGPNGSGKSTLLRILAGLEEADQGTVSFAKGLRLSFIPQDQKFEPGKTVAKVVQEAFSASGQDQELDYRSSQVLTQTGFSDHQQQIETLSGGWKKRLSLACGLVGSPDVLLLDEPANHLDLEGILWLEKLLLNADFAWMMISHDRFLLENTAARTLELNPIYRQRFLLVDGSYSDLLAKRKLYLQEQQRQAASLKSTLQRETDWLNTSPQARGTKAKYRVNKAYSLMSELVEIRSRLQIETTQIDFSSQDRKTRKLIKLKNVSLSFGEQEILKDLDLLLSPGSAVGVLGLNGCGKTSLLRLIAKELVPGNGQVSHAPRLRIVYFDQHRAQLDSTKTLKETLAPESDSVDYRGQSLHLITWAKRFRFHPDQLQSPVGTLSGGEQARACIARLMLQPADVLLLDEPTNDLDIETLEALEESLLSFPGALVLVSHDRFMLNRLCKTFVGFTGEACLHFADYRQWQRALRKLKRKGSVGQAKPPKALKTMKNKGLSYLEQREYNSLEETIVAAEELAEGLQQKIEDPKIASNADVLAETYQELQSAEAEVERLYLRWEELEQKIKDKQLT